jgi:hypothetical protein
MHSVEQCHIGKNTRIVYRRGSDEDVSEEARESVANHLGRNKEKDAPPSVYPSTVVKFHCRQWTKTISCVALLRLATGEPIFSMDAYRTPICHNNESVFLRVPWSWIETPLVTERVECMLWKVSSHCRAHPPCQQLDCIAGKGHRNRFEVVE